jgi:hypothetical protein
MLGENRFRSAVPVIRFGFRIPRTYRSIVRFSEASFEASVVPEIPKKRPSAQLSLPFGPADFPDD